MEKKLYKSQQLASALYDDDKRAAEQLLEDGADPNLLLPTEGITALHYAAGSTSEMSLDFTRILLGYGADPNTRYELGCFDTARLISSGGSDPDLIHCLRSSVKAVLDSTSVDGLTPVHVAASWGHFEVLQCLLASGGDPTLQDEDGQTPLSLARNSDSWECVDLLRQAEDEIVEDEEEHHGDITYTRLADVLEATNFEENGGDSASSSFSGQLHDICQNHSISSDDLAQGDAAISFNASVNSSINFTNSQNLSGILMNRGCMKERQKKRVSFFNGIPEEEASDESSSNSKVEEEIEDEIADSRISSIEGGDSDRSQDHLSQEFIILEGQGLDVTSPDNSVIFHKRLSRDRRKTCMFSLLKSPTLSPVDHEAKSRQEDRPSPISHVLQETCTMLKDLDLNSTDSNRQLLRSDGRPFNSILKNCSSDPSPTSSVGSNLSIPDLSKFISESSPNLSSETTPQRSLDKVIPRSNKKCRSSMFKHLSPVGGDRNESKDAVEVREFFYYDRDADVGLIEQSLPSAIHSFNFTPDTSIPSAINSFNSTPDTSILDSQPAVCADVLSASKNTSRSCDDTALYDWKSFVSDEEENDRPSILEDLLNLNNSEIHSRLRELGEEPGPVTETTRRVYLILLTKMLKDPERERVKPAAEDSFKHELAQVLTGLKPIVNLSHLEVEMVAQFQQPDRKRKWREGILKSSFNYLLLDPRVSLNLPMRHTSLTPLEVFRIFVSAIFYVGKGKRARPYAHFYEALEDLKKRKKKEPSKKVKHIREIWSAGLGVISLHIFQNVIPVEAYTREACMVDSLTLQRLTNAKRGDYYGVASTWDGSKKRRMGVHLLHKACSIFLIEGERMIRPADIKVGQ